MKELLRSNNTVLLSYVEALLTDAGITHMVADGHMSVLEGSAGALPRRVLVAADEWIQAVNLINAAGLAQERADG